MKYIIVKNVRICYNMFYIHWIYSFFYKNYKKKISFFVNFINLQQPTCIVSHFRYSVFPNYRNFVYKNSEYRSFF